MKDVKVRVQESEKRSATCVTVSQNQERRLTFVQEIRYLSNPPDVLISIFLAKSQVLVQSKSNIVPI